MMRELSSGNKKIFSHTKFLKYVFQLTKFAFIYFKIYSTTLSLIIIWSLKRKKNIFYFKNNYK